MHFCHALAKAYGDGAIVAGHEVKSIAVGELDFPLLRSKRDWDNGEVPPAVAAAQQDIAWSQHLVIIHPLWIGMMPATLKGYLEQVYRPGGSLSAEARMASGLSCSRAEVPASSLQWACPPSSTVGISEHTASRV
jgi:putative NADPH-quinone reductase